MGYRVEPEYQLGAEPKSIDLWKMHRGADEYLILSIKLPDIEAPIISTDTVAAVYAHIRETKADALPVVILGNTGGRTGATVTRPEPNLVVIEFHLTDTQTTDDLELSPRQSPTTTRQEIPGDGYFDVLLEVNSGDRHFVAQCAVKAFQMVTRLADEP